MFLERFFLSTPVAIAMLASFAATALLVVGLGYRRLGTALAVTFAAAVASSIAGWFIGMLVAFAIATPGEGVGVAMFLLALLTAGVGGAVALAAGVAWIIWKRSRYTARAGRSPALLGLAGLLFVCAAGITAAHAVRVAPGLMSDRALTTQASGLDGPLRAEAREELLARGQEAVPSVIAALGSANRSDVHTFESGLNGSILYHLEVLGELGGPQAIAELRTWFNSDYAPDICATAARGLGEAGDAESAHAIAVLLEQRSYEWRKCHFELLRALTLLNAKDELSHVKSALQFAPDEEGTSFQIGLLGEGIQALAAFDTPEAWQTISEVANAGSGARKESVERILRDMNKTLPVAAAAPSPNGTP